jgi:signal transduction histidine kinase
MELLRAGERRLRRTNVELERLSAMRRDFLHVALHDLKSPVSAVASHLYNIEARLKELQLDEEVGWVERCEIRLQELLEFLHDLEVLGLLEAGEVQDQAGEVDLADLLTRLVDENQDLANMHHHRLSLEVAGDLPSVHAIDRLLHEAVLNFITNAIKYTPDGGTIVVRALRASGDTVRIEVEDNGIGVAPEAHGRLFQEFVRIKHDEEKLGRQPRSSGLGLSIVRRIITAMGGSVGVDSRVDEGSTFRIDLPVDARAPDSAP